MANASLDSEHTNWLILNILALCLQPFPEGRNLCLPKTLSLDLPLDIP